MSLSVSITEPNEDLRECDGCGETLIGRTEQYRYEMWLLCFACQKEQAAKRMRESA